MRGRAGLAPVRLVSLQTLIDSRRQSAFKFSKPSVPRRRCPMTAPRRNPAAGIAVALAALAATPAFAQSQDAGRTLANGESIVIDGRTFSITPGISKNDLASPSGQPGARRLGAGVVIFRSGDGLYMVDRAPSPSTATTADTPASGPPRADGPRNSAVDCGRVSA